MNVLGLVLGNAARVIGTGVAIGLMLAFAFAQSVASFLFGVQPRDPVTFGVSRAGAGADGVGGVCGAGAAGRACRSG